MKRTIIYILTVLLYITDIAAQNVKYYSVEHLANTSLSCMAQDSKGFIWIGTEYGLERFDGYKFVFYHHEKGNSMSLSDNNVTYLLTDRNGELLIGTGSGMAKYDPDNDSFKRYSIHDGTMPHISQILQLHSGQIIAGTEGYGLYLMDGSNMRMTSASRRSSTGFYSRLYADKQGFLWIGDKSNIIKRINIRNNRIVGQYSTGACGMPSRMLADKRGNLYILCMHGLLRFDSRRGTLSQADVDMSACKGCFFSCARFDSGNNLYMGTVGSGIFILPNGSKKVLKYTLPSSKYDLSNADIRDIFEDRDHNIWIACNQKGLFFVSKNRSPFHVFNTQTNKSEAAITFIAPAPANNVFCLLQDKMYTYDINAKPLSTNTVPLGGYCIHRDRQQHCWIASNSTLYKYDVNTGNWSADIKLNGDITGAMADDGHGTLFISTFSKGLCVYDTKSGKVKQYDMNDKSRKKDNRLCNNWIPSLCYDSRGLLWIGTTDGITVYDSRHDSFKPLGWTSQLRSTIISAITEMHNGDIAIGSKEGLYVFNRKKNKIYPFPNARQLENIAINGLTVDDDGDLWAATSHGLWLYRNKQNNFTCYDHGNGALLNVFTTNLMTLTEKGNIAIGMNDNVVIFNPREVKKGKEAIGTPILTRMLLSGQSVNCGTLSNGSTVTELPLTESHRFVISYQEGSLSMEFSLFNFSDSKDIAYEYRINGGIWNMGEMGSNTITLNMIDIGKQVVEVRAYFDGEYSAIQTYYVTVTPPWYLSTLAYILYAIIVFAIILYIGYNLKRRQEELMKEDKMQFLINATHDIRSPMTLVMSPLQQLLKRTDLDYECQRGLSIMNRNAQRVLTLVNQILDVRKFDKHQMPLCCQPTEMNKYIANVCRNFDYMAEEKNISFRFSRNRSNVVAYIDRANFDKVITNLLSNAFKFTQEGGEIIVSCREKHSNEDKGPLTDYFEMTVTDTGTGITEKHPERLFDRFYQSANSRQQHADGSGIGLNLCELIVTQHKGSISAANRSDGMHGSVFTVCIPLGKEHLQEQDILMPKDKEEQESKNRRTSTNYNILVADDDVDLADYISGELEEYYNFHVCYDGKRALTEMLKGSYDLLISDVMMPGMNGIELLKAVKGNPQTCHIPVILLTSKTDAENRLKGIETGADAYMNKPFDIDELHARIDALMTNIQRLRGKFSGALQQADRLEEKEVTGNNDELLERIMKSVNANISDSDFSIEQLASDVGISRAHLHRKMKEITGVSTSIFIRNIRMERAAKLISEEKINITQVAYEVGFSSEAHFSTVFRKHFGVSPTEYTKQKLS